MVETDRAVRGSGGTEVLEVRGGGLVEFRAEVLVETLDVRDLFHDLHADRGAEELRVGHFRGLEVDDPVRFPAFIREETEIGDKAGDGPEQLDDAGVAVAAGAEHAVGIDDGGRFCPGQYIALLRGVADLGHVARAGVGVLAGVLHTELFELFVVGTLFRVDDFGDDFRDRVLGDVLVIGERVAGQFLLRQAPFVDELLVEVEDRP